MIERKKYLERLISKKENGLVKVITGIRRCGKSYLLFNIYKDYLKSIGVEYACIICLALDDDENIKYRNPLELGKYIRSLTSDESKTYYVFLDEIQKVVREDGASAMDMDYMRYLTQDTPPKIEGNKRTYTFLAKYVYRCLFCKDIFFKNEQEYRIVLQNEKIETSRNYRVNYSKNLGIMNLDEFLSL